MTEIVTVEKIENLDTDIMKAGQATNEDTIVKPRYGNEFKSFPMVSREAQENLTNAVRQVIETGGFEPFATEVELLASTPTLTKKAAKALDTKKVWLWDGKWNDTGSSEKDLAIAHSDAEISKTNKSLVEIIDLNKAPFSPDKQNLLLEVYNGSDLSMSIDEDNVLNANIPQQEIDVSDLKVGFSAPFSPSNVNDYQYKIMSGDKTLIELDENKEPKLIGVKPNQPVIPDAVNALAFDSWYSVDAKLYYANHFGSHLALSQQVFNPIAISAKACIASIQKNWITQSIQQAIIAKSGHVFPNPEKTLIIIPVYGQSLGMGDSGFPLVTVTNDNPDHALKFKDKPVRVGALSSIIQLDSFTDFDPIVAISSSASSGETITETICQQLVAQLKEESGITPRVLMFTSAVGGIEYERLKKGTQMYANFMTAIMAAKVIAEKKGWRVFVPAFVFQHGEADRGKVAETYKANLNSIISDVNVDIKAITGQTSDVYMYYSNPTGTEISASFRSNIAMYQLGKENPLAVHSHSVYPAMPAGVANNLTDEGDMTHLTARGYIYMGYKYVQAILHDLKHGMGGFRGVYPLSVTRTDNVIDIKFNVPKPPLVYRTSDFVLPDETWGFSYSDSTNSATITNVQIISEDTVRVTLSNTPTGESREIKGGHKLRLTNTLIDRPRINLTDSTEGSTPLGDDLCHWAISFNELVN